MAAQEFVLLHLNGDDKALVNGQYQSLQVMFVSLPHLGIKQNLLTIDKSFTDTENKIVNVRFPEKSFQPVSFSYFHYIIFLQLNGFLVLFPSLWYFFFPFPFNRLFLLD
ncbi:hypothetical protein WN944_023069 [Citrus x changshan-huyou]|uniref:Uncharacterized protein n=1 Tax=Citrus x changshan-huyou TaxID=2935761 RepID=A0AAP0MZM6_9ROSI